VPAQNSAGTQKKISAIAEPGAKVQSKTPIAYAANAAAARAEGPRVGSRAIR